MAFLADFQNVLVKNRIDFLAKSFLMLFILLATIAVLISSINYLVKSNVDNSSVYNKDEYHIVFLDNNLFYFCKLKEVNADFVNCNDPYYLVRKQEEVAAGKREDKIYIRKPVEEEIYQPEGPITLKKDNIVYIAKVGSKSSVMEHINKNSNQ